MRPRSLLAVSALLIGANCNAHPVAEPVEQEQQCVARSAWVKGGEGRQVGNSAVLRELAKQRAVLLGEDHDNPEHHRWQLHTIAQLYAIEPNMAIGFESFPRKVQPLLDKWVAGDLDEKEFLSAVDWATIWTYDANLYMPIFAFARMNRIPMVALNVERSLVTQVGEKGWDGVPIDQREGVTTPAPPQQAYVELLADIFGQHRAAPGHGAPGHEAAPGDTPVHGTAAATAAPETPPAPDLKNPALLRFVQSQTVWDRAMAEAIYKALHKDKVRLVVGVLGAGHIMGGFGVPYQLKQLGEKRTVTALPWDGSLECDALHRAVVDYAFGVDSDFGPSDQADEKPKLGVYLEMSNNGVLIKKVVADSVAEKAQLQEGDIITRVAGKKAEKVSHVVEAVQRTAFGTWLPLLITRGTEEKEIIARFQSKP